MKERRDRERQETLVQKRELIEVASEEQDGVMDNLLKALKSGKAFFVSRPERTPDDSGASASKGKRTPRAQKTEAQPNKSRPRENSFESEINQLAAHTPTSTPSKQNAKPSSSQKGSDRKLDFLTTLGSHLLGSGALSSGDAVSSSTADKSNSASAQKPTAQKPNPYSLSDSGPKPQSSVAPVNGRAAASNTSSSTSGATNGQSHTQVAASPLSQHTIQNQQSQQNLAAAAYRSEAEQLLERLRKL